MKIRKSILTVFIAVLAVSVCAVGVMASDMGDLGSFSKENVDAVKKELQAEGRYDVVEEMKFAGLTDEEVKDLEIAEGNAEIVEEIKKREAELLAEHQKKYATDEKYRKSCDGIKMSIMNKEEQAAERRKACESLLQLSGLYTDGVNWVRNRYDKDYFAKYISDLCSSYTEYKQNISDNDKALIEEFLNGVHDEIVLKNELTKKDAETYKLIEKQST